ncbi:hypothetical protein C0992_011497 [Termitomyces sp. T32_za158]|nr:hypothetical protein C0992_011497 [Termitomyces sp. T32_za158]
MGQEIRQLVSLFKGLDTPREKNIRQIIESNHGARNSINDDQVLQRLLQISEEDTSDQLGIEKLNATRKSLERELVEDVKEALDQNSTIFQGKLDILSGQIVDGNDKLSKVIVNVSALSGGHEKIVDPLIRSIWKEMGWKSHTKARHFAHALRDFYFYKEDQISDNNTDRHKSDYQSALSYFNISHLQAIAEAFDDDGSGFITIQEVNSFTKSKPGEWSLRAKVRLENRQALDLHLHERVFDQLELLLRSTRTEERIVLPRELERLRDQYTCQEEERMHADLRKIAYTIDSSATVSLVTGQGRIERVSTGI